MNKLHVLLVDDNPDDRLMVIKELQKEFSELEIIQIVNMEQFDEILDKDYFDIVITDYQLHWSTGLDILKMVKIQCYDCPVIMFTGTGSEEIAVEAMKTGLDDYILKSPKHFIRLTIVVKAVLEKAKQRRERKEIEKLLRKSEQEKAAILNNMSEIVVFQDLEHKIIWANRATETSVGLTSEKLVGHLCYEVWNKSSKPCIGCPIEKAIKTGQPQEGEINTPDGREWFVGGYPVKGEDGKIYGTVEVALDITKRKQGEKELKKKIRYLERFQKLTVGRELKMIELKKKIKELEEKLGKKK